MGPLDYLALPFRWIGRAIGDWFARHARGLAWTGAALVATLSAGILFVSFLPQILGEFAPTIANPQTLYTANRPIAISFVDADGDVVGHRGAIVGERLTLKQMPAYLPEAFIAMEDRSFWTNSGIDVKGLLRAAYLNLRAGHVVAGGSTITQQVAKIVYTSQERTFARKFTELFDAAALNKSLSKTQILTLYLNRIYLGSGAYGVDGAAHAYFGKSATQLSLPEAAMLATLTRAPSAFSPRRNLKSAQRRTKTVLRAMVETGAISAAEAQWAMAHPATIVDRSAMDARNYYFDTAADQAKQLITVDGKTPDTDLVVHTTFEPKIQDAARKSISSVLDKQGKHRRASEAAVVVMKPDGAVAALIGGRNYDDSVFNRATQALRQPGSSFKPFVYMAALEQGMSPWDMRTDQPVDINGWKPTNYGGEQFGTITLSDALAHSVNTITAELAQEVGVNAVVRAAQRCGITSPLEAVPSIALGTSLVTPFEMTRAYAVFANGGMSVTPYLVTDVEDTRGDILYRRVPPKPSRVIAGHVDRDLTAMLYEVVTDGTGRRAAVAGHEVAGKTGTTQDYHDAWFMGFSADYVTGVWVGNDDSSPMRVVTGGSLPAEIWHLTMTAAEKGLKSTPLDRTQPPVMMDTTDQNGVLLSSGNPDNEAPPPPPPPPQQTHHDFWDWLFGRDGKSSDNQQRRPAPPAPQDQSVRRYPPAAVQRTPAPDSSGQYGDNSDNSDAPPPPRKVPHYKWRSDPRWKQAPAQNGSQDNRQYGIDPNQPH